MKHVKPAQVRGIISVRAEAPADVAGALKALKTDWEEFKSAQYERENNIAAKFDDVVTKDKVERINASVESLQSELDKVAAKIAAQSMGVGAGNAPVDAEYTSAFSAYFRKDTVQASLNKGTTSDGGYLAPVEWDRSITDKLIEVSPMRQIANVMSVSKAGITRLYNLHGAASGWVGEVAARPETNTPQFGSMSPPIGELYANPAASQQLLDDAEINLENWLASEVETQFSLAEGLAFVAGDGTNKPIGFLSHATGAANAATNPIGSIETLTGASATAITADEVIDLVYALPQVFSQNARFVMNRNTLREIRKLKDTTGQFMWQPSYAAGQPSTLAGYPVTEMQAMPDAVTGAMTMAFGDFQRGYLIIDRMGLRVLRDPFTNKPNVMFYTTKRVGGAVDNPEAIKIHKMA